MEEHIVALIPAYCPDEKMTELMAELVKEFSHIVVVNDGCDDSYKDIFEKISLYENVKILVHEVNRGKGAALKTGFKHIAENIKDAEAVVTLDADGQHTLKDTLACCEAFKEFKKENGKAPVVFGCRDFTSDSKIPPRSRFGNRLTSRLMKFFCDIVLSDTQTGLRVVSADILESLLEVSGERYEYEMNMIFALKDMDVPFKEVPIEIIYLDDNASSHFNPIKDSLRIYKVFIKFAISSFGSALLDLIIFRLLKGILTDAFIFDPIMASTVIARVCSGLFNYNFNRIIFRSKAKDIASSGPKYLLLWFVQMMLSGLIVKGLALISGTESAGLTTLIKMVVDTVLFFISYKIQQAWVFKRKKEED
ncbi:MAG: bifunctional glycosyltransferase family 2/GtrA family protein [Lachnospiraceae bacterium]|nr:bifunctional glycosyltransferase family 2/GtrA family protein [Lachnospiraceae bacterium]